MINEWMNAWIQLNEFTEICIIVMNILIINNYRSFIITNHNTEISLTIII